MRLNKDYVVWSVKHTTSGAWLVSGILGIRVYTYYTADEATDAYVAECERKLQYKT